MLVCWNRELDRNTALLAMGTGGVSIFALQFAKAAGAQVILTSSSDAKLARGKALGADHGINYRTTSDWAAAERELTHGRGLDELLEVGGVETLPMSLHAVREGGHVVLVGLLTGNMPDREEARTSAPGVRVDSVYVGSARHFERMNEAIARWGLRPIIDRTFPFDAAARAYRYLKSGGHFGKVVITI